MKKDLGNFSAKEIGIQINNVVQAALNPEAPKISDLRLQKLREYSFALLEPLLQHLDEQTYEENGVTYPAPLKPEELVTILLTAALFIQTSKVLKSNKLPKADFAEWMFTK